MIFRRTINPYNVIDTVTFSNGDKTLTLTVKANAADLVRNIKRVYETLSGITDATDDKSKADAASVFASAIFGPDQGARLCEFYGDPLAVITVCGIYFKDTLGKKITKAQRR